MVLDKYADYAYSIYLNSYLLVLESFVVLLILVVPKKCSCDRAYLSRFSCEQTDPVFE